MPLALCEPREHRSLERDTLVGPGVIRRLMHCCDASIPERTHALDERICVRGQSIVGRQHEQWHLG